MAQSSASVLTLGDGAIVERGSSAGELVIWDDMTTIRLMHCRNGPSAVTILLKRQNVCRSDAEIQKVRANIMRRSIRLRTLLFILTCLLLSISCSLLIGRDPGLIIYDTSYTFEGPQREPRLRIVDSEGEVLHTIRLPGQVVNVYPLQSSMRILYWTTEGLYLIDADSGTRRELIFPNLEFADIATTPFRISRTRGEPWVTLHSNEGDRAFLVNTESGQVYDLMDVDDGPESILDAHFSPDQEYVFLPDSGVWLVPTDDPRSAFSLGSPDAIAHGGSFSSDGSRIVYVEERGSGDDQRYSVIVENLDDPSREEVYTDDEFVEAWFVPWHEWLLITQKGRLDLLSLMDESLETLLDLGDGMLGLWGGSPDGSKLVVAFEQDDDVRWYWVDLESGTFKHVPLLDDYAWYSTYWLLDWYFFADDANSPRMFVSMDSETGDATEVASLPDFDGFRRILNSSDDGRMLLIQDYEAERGSSIWLLRADTAGEILLAEGDVAFGLLSPDGSWVALSTYLADDDSDRGEVSLVATEGDEVRLLGQGFGGLWIRRNGGSPIGDFLDGLLGE